MAFQLLLHIANEDPVIVDTERLPEPTDTSILGKNPRRKDNKEIHYLMPDVTTVIYPMWRINFIELMPTGEEEEIFKPFRD